LLLSYRAIKETPNKDGLTPLQIALSEGHLKIVQLLSIVGDKSLKNSAIETIPKYFQTKI
jgi:ankyrin repeat protein